MARKIGFERHHKMWPRAAYAKAGKTAWLFRNLACNIELITNEQHREIHAKHRETPGGMPSHSFMAAQIADCFARGCSKTSCKIARGKIDSLEIVEDK